MAVIQAWKCLKTGKLFESKRAYKKHRAALAVEARHQLVMARGRRNYERDLAELVSVERSLPELMAALIAEQHKFWPQARLAHDWMYGRKKDITKFPELVSATLISMNYRDRVSNSHCCPRGGITNWSGHADKPRGYPGWLGRIDFKYRWAKKGAGYYPGNALFQVIGVQTGSGGGGLAVPDENDANYIIQSHSYSVEIFAHDHPGLWRYHARQVEQQRRADAWAQLGGKRVAMPEIEDSWEPPELPNLNEYLINPQLTTGYVYA